MTDAPRDIAAGPLVIVGPTASGKSSLAVQLARRHPGTEIVSSDAMAVYRGMDIGTAKPTPAERDGIPHHLIDVVEPTEDYTVARFQREVAAVLDDLAVRSRPAIVVGGTGLYVQAVVDDFTMPDQFPELRSELEAEADTAALFDRLQALDPAAATKMLPGNRRRIIRALEVTIGSGRPFSSFGPGVDHYGPTRFRLVGLEIDRAEMDRRIDERYRQQLEAGFLAEVERLSGIGLSRNPSQALGYRELLAHVRGECGLDEAVDEARRRTKRFARRQQRWFRRDPRITWFDALDAALVDEVADHWHGVEGGGTVVSIG
ncbi:MAG: tRNA (adenosine(37)-N6)-dimethylallyltransferase MiaA [Acidimicrobiales bacterium]